MKYILATHVCLFLMVVDYILDNAVAVGLVLVYMYVCRDSVIVFCS